MSGNYSNKHYFLANNQFIFKLFLVLLHSVIQYDSAEDF